MINSIHIILNSGILIFNKSFKEEVSFFNSKEFLISGLFTAIKQLVHETLKDDLQELILQNQKIFFTFHENYFIVLITRFDADSENIKEILAEIDQNFSEKYDLSDYKGSIDEYFDFEHIVIGIIEKYKTKEMKLAEIYQNIISKNIKLSKLKKKRFNQ